MFSKDKSIVKKAGTFLLHSRCFLKGESSASNNKFDTLYRTSPKVLLAVDIEVIHPSTRQML